MRCLACLLLLSAAALAAPLLTEGFETQGKWKKNVRGKGVIELVDGGVHGGCLKVVSEDKALAYYSIELDARQVAGRRLIIRSQVKLDGVAVGPEVYSTAKLHVGIKVGGKTENCAQRFVGTRDWHTQVLAAEIPEGASRVVLDLGIQNGTGTAWFDDLVVDDGVKEHVVLDIKPAANAAYCDEVAPVPPFDLRGLPVADLKLEGVDFFVLPPEANHGRTCIALRGKAAPGLPARIETVVPVGHKAKRLFFLLAAAGEGSGDKPVCLNVEARYADGKSATILLREGVDIGSLTRPAALPNWTVAWTAKRGASITGLGVATWHNPRPDVPIQWLRASTPGTGAAPIIVAISLDPTK